MNDQGNETTCLVYGVHLKWREAFKEKFRKPDGKGPIGVADASWVRPSGDRLFPYVGDDGFSDFGWADLARHGRWRWLVACE